MASPDVHLPAQGLARPALDHGGGDEIYQLHYCSWPPEDHWRERGRQASVGVWKGLLEDARVDRPHLDRTARPRGQV